MIHDPTLSYALNDLHLRVDELEKRLARIESRLVQLMIHLGADPHGKN
jgi:hypothetical protein